jgi:hypothetical protein
MKRIVPKEMLPRLFRGASIEDWPTGCFVDFPPEDMGRPLPAMPDWHDEAAYPKPEALSPRAWGWEFLRRNPEYQMDWSDNQLRPGRWGLSEEVDPAISPHEPVLAPGFPRGRPQFRARRKYYPTYLRVWDARCAGALIAEISSTIYGPGDGDRKDDWVNKDVEAALRLVWFNYENLLFTP